MMREFACSQCISMNAMHDQMNERKKRRDVNIIIIIIRKMEREDED